MHHLSCLQLEKIIDNITPILAAIESARPRVQSGILALCSLHQCIEKCKLLLRHCSESSKLYLAISGKRIIWRCERIRYSMERCLSQLQDMVETKLATRISHAVDYIKTVAFTMDSSEKEAGKVLLNLLQQDRKASSFADHLEEPKAFKFASFRLQITSPMALMVEKQSIKDLLSKIRDTDPAAKKILKYLLYLVRKYGESIKEVQEPETISNESNGGDDDDVSIRSSETNTIVDYVSSTEDGSGKIIHDESERFKSRDPNTDNGTNVFVLEKLSVLPWAFKCKTVEDVISGLKKDDHGSRTFVSTRGYIKPVLKFLKEAHRLGDYGAKRNGAKLLLMFLNECRSEEPPLPKEAMHYLYLFLDSEIIEEALPILELLSCHQHYSSEIVSSGVPSFLLQLIKNPNSQHHDFALRILCNLSAHTDLGDHLVYLGFIQHLVPFLDHCILSAYCVKIFRNLCTIEEAAAQLIEDEICIECIGDILDQQGKDEEQENALHILLSLCHQHEELREILMQKSIVSSLVDISQNGSCGGKLISMKLLQFLNHQDMLNLKSWSFSPQTLIN